MAKKVRTHKVVVTLSFNKPISRADAVREAKDNIHGDFYTSFGWQQDDERKYPGKAKIGRGIRAFVDPR